MNNTTEAEGGPASQDKAARLRERQAEAAGPKKPVATPELLLQISTHLCCAMLKNPIERGNNSHPERASSMARDLASEAGYDVA